MGRGVGTSVGVAVGVGVGTDVGVGVLVECGTCPVVADPQAVSMLATITIQRMVATVRVRLTLRNHKRLIRCS